MDIIEKITAYKNSGVLAKAARYVLVGGLATILDYSVFFFTINVLHFYYLIANTAAFAAGLTFNYYFSREWVFNKKVHNFKRDFTLYAVTSLLGLVINNGMLYVLIDLSAMQYLLKHMFDFSSDNLTKLFAKSFCTLVVLIWNYMTKSRIVFK